MNAAFDVGADDGLHGILFAFLNPKINIFAFEPIKGSKKKILKNLKNVEKFFKIQIKNYKIINCAISTFNGNTTFYETDYRVSSSLLKPKKKLDKHWTKSEDLLIKTVSKGVKIKRKYKVKVITLEKFCKEKSIKVINYLHSDAQGNDLKVIKSLKKFRKCLIEGVAEITENKNLSMYDREQSLKDLKKKFRAWKFKIKYINRIQKNMPYFDVHFATNNKIDQENKIIFKPPTKRIVRMFKRIFSNQVNFKDIIFSYFLLFRRVYK